MRLLKLYLYLFVLQACAAVIGTSETTKTVIADLTRLANAWDAAILRKDRSAINANMAAEFRHIRHNGVVSNRGEFLDFLTSYRLIIDPYQVEDFDVRVYGDVALVSGRTRMTGSYDDTPFKAHYRHVEVYARTSGKWKVVSAQITPIIEGIG